MLAAVAPIGPLAWERPCAVGVTLKSKNKKKKQKKKPQTNKKQQQRNLSSIKKNQQMKQLFEYHYF